MSKSKSAMSSRSRSSPTRGSSGCPSALQHISSTTNSSISESLKSLQKSKRWMGHYFLPPGECDRTEKWLPAVEEKNAPSPLEQQGCRFHPPPVNEPLLPSRRVGMFTVTTENTSKNLCLQAQCAVFPGYFMNNISLFCFCKTLDVLLSPFILS